MIAALFATAMAAYSVDVKFCVDMNTSFVDTIPAADYWTTNAARPLRGFYYIITGPSSSQIGYLEDSGANTGCVTKNLLGDATYTMSIVSKADVFGHKLEAYEPYGGGISLVTTVVGTLTLPSYAVAGPISKNYSLGFDNTYGPLLVGTQMISRYDFGKATSYIQRFNASGCCYNTGNGWIFAATSRMRTIAHEFGHSIGRALDDNTSPNKNYDAAEDGCDAYGVAQSAHGQATKEYPSAAAVEGFADFVAAAAFNSRGQSSCHYQKSTAGDWDLDGDSDTNYSNDQISCEGSALDLNHDGDTIDANEQPNVLDPFPAWIGARDWMEEGIVNTAVCTGPLTDRDSRHDWLRFLWDLTTDEGIHPDQIGEIWDDMNPRTWYQRGRSNTPPPAAGWMPFERLQAACLSNGYATECASQYNNGVDHW